MAETDAQVGLGSAQTRPAEGTSLASIRAFPAGAGMIDLDLDVGDIVHLVGGNGSGKTSLLRGLAGLDAPLQAAAVTVLGRDPRTLKAPELTRSVRALWASARGGLVGLTVAGEFRLRSVPLPPGLAHLADRDVATLSSGEARRVALATVVASDAPLLLLDEPCAAFDADGLRALTDLVRRARRGAAVVIADHTGWAAAVATRTVELGPSPAATAMALPPRPEGPTMLVAPDALVRRGATLVHLPGLALAAGFHAVTGRNGAGKSTLLQRLAGLRHAQGVFVHDRPPQPGVGVRLLQPGAGDLLMERTVQAELAGAADPEGLVPSALLGRHPLSLSAGEAHRVALVKALGHAAAVHLLDEPEAHLDADARQRLVAAIARRLADGACVVAATHDAGLIKIAGSRVAVGP